MDMMEQILHGIVFLLLFLQHVIRLLQMEKEMDMIRQDGNYDSILPNMESKTSSIFQ